MRSIAFILIFLFLVTSNCTVGAETQTEPWIVSSTTTGDYEGYTAGTAVVAVNFNMLCVGDVANFQALKRLGISETNNHFSTTADYYWSDVEYKIGADIIGTGSAGFNKGDTKTFILYFMDESLDFSDYSGLQRIEVVGFTDKIKSIRRKTGGSVTATQIQAIQYYDGYNCPITPGSGGYGYDYNYYKQYSFKNQISVTEISSYQYTIDISRDVGNQTKYVIVGGTTEYLNESSLDHETINISVIENPVIITGINSYSDQYSHTFFSSVLSVGSLILNQSLYTEPELIQIDAELTTYDFTNHIYRILMEYSTDDGANWERLSVAFNSTSMMSNATECRTATIDSSYYTLPIKIRAVIDDYDKPTSSSSTIATSSEVYYNPPSAYDYIVSGTVFNADNGAVIEGALVSASGVTTTTSTSTVTGKFQLYLSEGIYTITTSKSGYQDNVQTDLLIDHDVTWAQIHLTPIGYGNNTLYGNINDVDTGNAIQDVHVIITNTTDQIDAYTSSGGYYEATGLAQSSTYTVRALKTGYHPYNGTVTTEATGASHKSFEMVQVNYSVTPTPTVVSTYPGGEGHEWSNDEIVTMLRVLVPGFFMMMLIFLFIAVILGVTGGGGANGGQRGLGLDEIWKR